MPELPEVETVAVQLRKVLVGKRINRVEVLRERSFSGKEKLVVGRKITEVLRKGKVIVFKTDKKDVVLMTHLKMTGQLIWRPKGKEKSEDGLYVGDQVVGGHPSEDWIVGLPSKHTRVIIHFGDGSTLFFNDMRVFGWIKVVDEKEYLEVIGKMPVDVIDREFTLEHFTSLVERSNKAIKLVVMDSGRMGGVGNIYANDALNLAKINPFFVAKNLSSEKIKKLYLAIKKVIDLGIEYGGATYSDFKDLMGYGGSYQNHFLVYKREGKMCKNCDGIIEKKKLGGRGTYFCPNCQK